MVMLINARDFHYQIDFRNLKKKEKKKRFETSTCNFNNNNNNKPYFSIWFLMCSHEYKRLFEDLFYILYMAFKTRHYF